jgi:transcription elongation factor SPT6
VAPYEVNFGDKKGWDTEKGIRVLGLSFGADQEVFGCLINGDGERSNRIHLKHILAKLKNAEKGKDLEETKNFISKHKPHVIAVSSDSKKAAKLIEDLRAIIAQLVKDEKWQTMNVELVDNSLAKVFAKSTRAKTEFPQDLLYCEAIIIARVLQVNLLSASFIFNRIQSNFKFFFIQDALLAYAQLSNKDMLKLKYHPLQKQLSKEELLEGLNQEFVNRTNEVGVDINRAINHPRTAHLLQFTCGLGPRKAKALIQTLKLNNQQLENRSQFVTACHMGPKVNLLHGYNFVKTIF